MKLKFNKLSVNDMKEFQVEAGIVLNKFTPASPNVQDEDIISATTGGIRASCVPTVVDHGADVDNCPPNLKELQEVTGYTCSLGFTALGHTADSIKMALGAAATGEPTGSATKITASTGMISSHCKDVWFVGDLMGGGMIAICLKNAFTSGGYNLQTGKNAKGQLTVDLVGHPTIATKDDAPMEFYVAASVSLPAAASVTGKNKEA